MQAITEVEKVRRSYEDDESISNEEYGRMIEEADERDWEASTQAEAAPMYEA
jgi:hypothetical protein